MCVVLCDLGRTSYASLNKHYYFPTRSIHLSLPALAADDFVSLLQYLPNGVRSAPIGAIKEPTFNGKAIASTTYALCRLLLLLLLTLTPPAEQQQQLQQHQHHHGGGIAAMDREAFHAFTLFDKDGDGFITQDEMRRYLKVSMRSAGMAEADVNAAAHEATLNWSVTQSPTHSVDQEFLGRSSDCDRRPAPQQPNIPHSCPPPLSPPSLRRSFRISDRNYDGVLSFDEFKRWYQSPGLLAGPGGGGGGGPAVAAVPRPHYRPRRHCYPHPPRARRRRDSRAYGDVLLQRRLPRATLTAGRTSPSATKRRRRTRGQQHRPERQGLLPERLRGVRAAHHRARRTLGGNGGQRRAAAAASAAVPAGRQERWSVYKRYSSPRLVRQLRKQLPRGTASVNATFPPKVIGKVNVEERRVGLEWFLKTSSGASIRQRQLVQQFLRSSGAEPPNRYPNGQPRGIKRHNRQGLFQPQHQQHQPQHQQQPPLNAPLPPLPPIPLIGSQSPESFGRLLRIWLRIRQRQRLRQKRQRQRQRQRLQWQHFAEPRRFLGGSHSSKRRPKISAATGAAAGGRIGERRGGFVRCDGRHESRGATGRLGHRAPGASPRVHLASANGRRRWQQR